LAASDIEWTDKVWNPVRGCSLVSQGCKNCYAMRQARRMSGPGQPYEGLTVLNATGPTWTGKVVCDESKLDEPLHWKKPCRIFVNSMGDLFHEDVPFTFIDQVFAAMALCPQHIFQILTKRPARMLEYFSCDTGLEWKGTNGLADAPAPRKDAIAVMAFEMYQGADRFTDNEMMIQDKRWPLPNVWLGVSVEDQKTADERIPLLLQTPAAVRWVSYEPALGPVGLGRLVWFKEGFSDPDFQEKSMGRSRLDWVVCGGESGPGARPMHPDWARSVRDQCVAAGVPFFFKQWGQFSPDECGPRGEWVRRDGGCIKPPLQPGEAKFMFGVGKKAAGRLLDGREWNEYPKPETRNSKLETRN
jgi:protein gp37